MLRKPVPAGITHCASPVASPRHFTLGKDLVRTWRAAQTAFVAGHPARSFVLAKGSSHKIMNDKPDLVVSKIQHMILRVYSK